MVHLSAPNRLCSQVLARSEVQNARPNLESKSPLVLDNKKHNLYTYVVNLQCKAMKGRRRA